MSQVTPIRSTVRSTPTPVRTEQVNYKKDNTDTFTLSFSEVFLLMCYLLVIDVCFANMFVIMFIVSFTWLLWFFLFKKMVVTEYYLQISSIASIIITIIIFIMTCFGRADRIDHCKILANNTVS